MNRKINNKGRDKGVDSRENNSKDGGKSQQRVGKSRAPKGAKGQSNGKPKSKSSSRPNTGLNRTKRDDTLMSDSGSTYTAKPLFGKSKPTFSKHGKSSKALDGSTRLNKFIANAGICSRREADTYIEAGVVTINGVVVVEMGAKVMPGDEVNFQGQKLVSENKVYFLLNKPKGYLTTSESLDTERTVMDLMKNASKESIYPVGRLDKETTGLLMLTNDGDLTTRLTHPKYNRKKIYHVFCDKKVTKSDINKILHGITLEDGFVKADAVSYIDDEDLHQVGIEIHSGKSRIVRRMFGKLGYKVEKLDRVYFCGLTKLNLPRGKWRQLTAKEVGILQMGNF